MQVLVTKHFIFLISPCTRIVWRSRVTLYDLYSQYVYSGMPTQISINGFSEIQQSCSCGKSSTFSAGLQTVLVRSCLMALYRWTNDFSHTRCCRLQVALTTCWAVYTRVISVHSKSSCSRAPFWLDSSEMSCNISVCFLGTISSQMTFKFLALRSDASSPSCTENSPLSLNCTPARRISRGKSKGQRRERGQVSACCPMYHYWISIE